jgi:hypothetical protein
MRKLLNNPKVVAVLALAAVAFVALSLRPQPADAIVAAAPSVGDAETRADVADAAATAPDWTEMRAALDSLAFVAHPRDPFSARVKSADEAAARAAKTPLPDIVDTVRLSAIWTQAGATYLIINGRICQAGDQLTRMKIESATQDGVWITHGDKRDFLSLGAAFTFATPVPRGLTAPAAVSTL